MLIQTARQILRRVEAAGNDSFLRAAYTRGSRDAGESVL